MHMKQLCARATIKALEMYPVSSLETTTWLSWSKSSKSFTIIMSVSEYTPPTWYKSEFLIKSEWWDKCFRNTPFRLLISTSLGRMWCSMNGNTRLHQQLSVLLFTVYTRILSGLMNFLADITETHSRNVKFPLSSFMKWTKRGMGPFASMHSHLQFSVQSPHPTKLFTSMESV